MYCRHERVLQSLPLLAIDILFPTKVCFVFLREIPPGAAPAGEHPAHPSGLIKKPIGAFFVFAKCNKESKGTFVSSLVYQVFRETKDKFVNDAFFLRMNNGEPRWTFDNEKPDSHLREILKSSDTMRQRESSGIRSSEVDCFSACPYGVAQTKMAQEPVYAALPENATRLLWQ